MLVSMKQRRNCAQLLILLIIPATLLAQKPTGNHRLEIITDPVEASYRKQNMRISRESGVPLALYRVDYPLKGTAASPEAQSRQYLRANAALLQLSPDLAGLQHVATVETPGGYHVRFRQQVQGYPVYQSTLVVSLDRRNQVVFVMNGFKPAARLPHTAPSLSRAEAAKIARRYLDVVSIPYFEQAETVIYCRRGVSRLTHRIAIGFVGQYGGNWEILVDATSGEVFRAEDKTCYHGGPQAPQENRSDGSAWVFDPDPLTRAGVFYGGDYADQDDADTGALTGQLITAVLPEITHDGGLYHLEGPYAKIFDWDIPLKGEFSQDSSNWFFTRSPDAFEAANLYYHIDKSMRYIHDVLGFAIMPIQYAGGVKADPHGWNGADQSAYLPFTGWLSFGEGGVDDAEDPDVILHELAHGLHDWLTNGDFSQVEGLSEGCGDYWAASNNRSSGFWSPSDPQYHWVFQWDGHNPFWSGRRTDYAVPYPGGLVGNIHTDGQIWSSTLMQIYQDIGRTATDANLLECLAMTNSITSQEDAAQAFLQADINLHGGVHLSAIEYRFSQRGYNISLPAPVITHQPLKDVKDLFGPYPVTATVTAAAPLTAVKLIYGHGGVFSDTLEMIPGGDEYSAAIPGIGTPAIYQYYIYAEDAGSLASTLPDGAPVQFFSFTTGPDQTPPQIVHTPISIANWYNLPVLLNADVRDNYAVERVWAEYQINGIAQPFFELSHQQGDLYSGYFPFDSSVVQIGDQISYRILARDNAAAANQSAHPVQGYHAFSVMNIFRTTRLVNIPIPDGDPAGVEDVINVAGTQGMAIVDVDFVFRANHSWVGDLSVKLAAPDGQQITLLDRPGVPATQFGCPGNGPEIILDDEAAQSIETIVFDDDDLVSGIFRPAPDELSAFDSRDPEGIWLLTVADNEFQDSGSILEWGFVFTLEKITALDDNQPALPANTCLFPNYPNPFNPETVISYQLSVVSDVELSIFDLLGRKVRTLVQQPRPAGSHAVRWDGRDAHGRALASGVYVCYLSAGDFQQARKIILLR